MKKINCLTSGFILTALLVAADGPSPELMASPAAVAPGLGSAVSFAVLGSTTVTNTGLSSVIGDLGVSPDTSVTGFPPGTVTGGTHLDDALAIQAQSDVDTAYSALAIQTCDEDLTGQDLGGLTLTPGVYCFDSSAGLTGTLTLDAQSDPSAVWVFQIGSTLTTAGNSSVTMNNGGLDCKVFWQIGSSATLGTGTVFAGNILADQSITLTTGASLSGRALARGAAITMDTNDISNGACFGPNAIVIQKFRAISADGPPFGLGAGAALLMALGLIVVRRRALETATPNPCP